MSRRIWISNLLLLVGVLLVGTPVLMHLYGGWTERREREAVLRDVPAASTIPTEAPPAALMQDRPSPVIPVAHHRTVARPKAKSVRVAAKPAPPTKTPVKPARHPARARVAASPAPPEFAGMVKPAGHLPRRRWERSVVQIPRIDVNAPVAKGVGNWRLITGPAYEVWSAGPGGSGNPVIAAHRNMWDETFMHLPRVRPGDPVYIVTRSHRYLYRVDTSRQASTKERQLLSDSKDPRITLYTCVLPFNKNRRWVVQGHLVGIQDLRQDPRQDLRQGRVASR